MGLLERLKRLVGVGGNAAGVRGSFRSSGDNYVCGACQATFERQHHSCPECGSPILVPIEEADLDDGGGPF